MMKWQESSILHRQYGGAFSYTFYWRVPWLFFRTCIPAEPEPAIPSSSCCPLVNLSRPVCENQGVRLDKFVYQTPDYQIRKNDEGNKIIDILKNLGEKRASHYLGVDISTLRKCKKVLFQLYCHYSYPTCDRTLGVPRKQQICRETCLEALQTCSVLSILARNVEIHFPNHKKFSNCELQPPRNAGEAPECWYHKYSGTIFVIT